MPGSAHSPLSDLELAAVLNWMIREFASGELAADWLAFRAEEIAAFRQPPLTDVDSRRRELLSRIEAADRAPPGRPSR